MISDTSQPGYKYLLSYQYSAVICDLTQEFCQKFIPGRELMRQRDQMTQAARSGKQNIVEGYQLESLETYIKFLGIAKGSLSELLEDYEDFLRQKRLVRWEKNSPEMRGLRDVRVMRVSKNFIIPQFPHLPQNPQLSANLLVMLCQRTTYLLEKQIEALTDKFVKEGGFRERLFRQRMEYKNNKSF